MPFVFDQREKSPRDPSRSFGMTMPSVRTKAQIVASRRYKDAQSTPKEVNCLEYKYERKGQTMSLYLAHPARGQTFGPFNEGSVKGRKPGALLA